NEPVVACPPGRLYRLQKLVRRNKLAFSAAATISILLVLAVVVSAWEARVQSRLRRQATTAQVNESRERANAESRLYDSLLGEARATRAARRIGYRDKVFALVQRAKDLNLPQRDLNALRQEAVACMGDFVGLTPVKFADLPENIFISTACL